MIDPYNIQTLIAQGKLIQVADLDPNKTYLELGVYQEGNRQIAPGNANSYPSYAVTLQDVLNSAGGGGGGLTCATLAACQEIIDINADIASINAILPTKFNNPTGNVNQYIRGNGTLALFPTIPAQYNPTAGPGISITGAYPNQTIANTGVTSVGLSMPPAFNVTNSPVTGSDTIAVTAAGLSSQYVRGDGVLSNFPEFGGGGASASYYLNGGTSQGTFGSDTYYEMNRLAIAGVPANFTRTAVSGNGYIAYFITDAGDPGQLSLPGGNWDFKMYMNADSAGGNPSFYVELYKYDGLTFTLIADNSTNPEPITGGATIDLYTITLAVTTTPLALTDRLAVRIFVNVGGKNITLYTQNGTLCQIVTTFTTGLTALNGLTPQIQTLSTGTSGTDFNINSVGSVHNFNLPTASATNRGALSSADWTTFNNKQNAITLTTTGTSGPATLLGSTLNVPQYSGNPIAIADEGTPVTAQVTSIDFTGAGVTASGVLGAVTVNISGPAPAINLFSYYNFI